MDLKLYKFDSCPYCQKVYREIEAQGRTDIEYRDILENEEYYQELMRSVGSIKCLAFSLMVNLSMRAMI